MRLKIRLTIIPLLLVLFGFSASALAVDYGGIGGTPANPDPNNPRTQSIFVYNLKPSESKTDGIKVFNSTDTAKTIQIYAVDSQVSSGGSLACAQKVEQKQDVGSWITLAKEEVSLEPKQSEIVPFTLNVPQTTGVGEHDGCLVIQDATATKEAQNGIALNFRSALRVVVTIPGDIFKRLSFVSLTHSTDKNGSPVVHAAIKNEGNVSVDTNIKVFIKNILGIKVADNGGGYPVLPRSSADWNFELKHPFWGGIYQISATANYDANTDKPLGVSSNNQTTISSPKQLVWISPKPLAAIIELAVLAVIIGSIYLIILKRRHQRELVTNWKAYRVKKDDTLNYIAKAHKIGWKKLVKANRIKPPYELKAGQEILVPPIEK